jgi:hypothetical protein
MTFVKLALLGMIAATGTLAVAACGDDDDDDRLTDEEYFAAVDEANRDLHQAFEEEIFNAESAKAGLEAFTAGAVSVQDGISDLNPPEDLQDLHDEYVAAVDDAVEFLEQTTEDTPEDAPIEDLESILFAEPNPSFEEIGAVECELTGIAEERGVALEFLECDDEAEAEGPEAAGDNPVAVEAVEFQFNLDGEFSADSSGFVLTNAGEQPHEAFIVRISEDANVDELLASEEEQPEGVEGEVGGTFAEPGGEAGFGFEEPLEPGRYLMLCFVEDEETGQPHALLGMVQEFSVE